MNKNKSKYIYLLVVSFLIIVVFVFYFGKSNKDILLVDRAIEEIKYVKSFFNTFESQDIKALSATLDSLLQDPGIKQRFLKKDREELSQYGQPLYQKLEAGYGITHFYFFEPDSTTFLRLHNPKVYGDTNNRITFKQAVESKNIGFGLELGKTAFALRVVKPYYDNGELIGYMELGQEIDHFLAVLKEETQNDYAIFVNKKDLSPVDWEESRKNNGKVNNWDDFLEMIIVNHTDNLEDKSAGQYPFCFNEVVAKKVSSKDLVDKVIIDDNLKMMCLGFPIKDASGNEVGVLLFKHDNSRSVAYFDAFILKINLIVVGIIVLTLLLTIFISRKSFSLEKKFKNLFDSSYEAIMTLEPPDWKFTDGNPATLKLFGLKDVKELQNITPGDLSPENQLDGRSSREKAKEMIDSALKNGSNTFEWTHKKLNGPEFIAQVSLNRLDNSSSLQAVVRDITEQKNAFDIAKKSEIEAKKSFDEIEKMNKLMVGRELEMIKLKKELADLENKK